MLTIRLPDELEARLNDLAKRTHRSKSFYVKEALEKYLESYEEVWDTFSEYEEKAKKGNLNQNTLDKIKKQLRVKDED